MNTHNDNYVPLTDEQKRQRKTIRTLARQAGARVSGWNAWPHERGPSVWLDDTPRWATYPEAIAYLTSLVEVDW